MFYVYFQGIMKIQKHENSKTYFFFSYDFSVNKYFLVLQNYKNIFLQKIHNSRNFMFSDFQNLENLDFSIYDRLMVIYHYLW